MSSYARVAHGMWGDEKFRRLSALRPSAQALWIHLITGPHNRGVPGLFRLSKQNLIEELGWSLKELDRCWGEIEREGMAVANWSERIVWIPSGPRHDRPGNPNVVAGWWRQLSPLPECELLMRALHGLRDWCAAEGQGWTDAFDKGLRKAFQKGFLEAFSKGCNARVPCPCPCPSPTPSPESLPGSSDAPATSAPGGSTGGVCAGQKSDPGKRDPEAAPVAHGAPAEPGPDTADDLAPDGDPRLLCEWNAGRAKHGLPPQRLSGDHEQAFIALRDATGGDGTLAAGVIAAYFAADDRFVAEAGWSLKVFPHRIDACLVEARRKGGRRVVATEPPKVFPRIGGASETELRPFARPLGPEGAWPFTVEEEREIGERIAAERQDAEKPATPRWRPRVDGVAS